MSVPTKSVPMPVFTNKELNRLKNKKAADELMPSVYKDIISWGCHKEKHETYLEYYERRSEKLWDDNRLQWEAEMEEEVMKNLEIRTKKWPEANRKKEELKCKKRWKEKKIAGLMIYESWSEEEKLQLNQKTCHGFDVTLLSKLVPAICDEIRHYDPNNLSATNIEGKLRDLKEKRNKISHRPEEESISPTVLDDIESAGVSALRAAGTLYSATLDKQTVQDKIDEFREMFVTIKEEVMSDDQQRIMQIAKKLIEDGMAEMHKAVLLQATDFLPLSNDKVTRMDVFHPVNVITSEQDEVSGTDPQETNREISCQELLTTFEGRHLLCEGHPGAGKSTFLKILREDFVVKGEPRFKGIRKFDFLLYMECRNGSVETIGQLIEQNYPKTLKQLKTKEAVKALLNLNLLICVDGLDELTSQSKKLHQELVSMFGHSDNATFIFTSRPGEQRSVGLDIQTVTLQVITKENEQVEFLKRYQTNIKGLKSPDLINAFQSLTEMCKGRLCQPIFLALFCFLFQKYPDTVKKWKNDLNLMEDFLRLSKLTMKERMDSMNFVNTECLSDDITNRIMDLGLCQLQQQKMTIDVKTYTLMCRDVFNRSDVNYYAILSSFFTKDCDQQTFEFFHKSTIEFIAAKAITRRLLDNPNRGVYDTIDAIINERRDWINIPNNASDTPILSGADSRRGSARRYENVFRFICMMLAEHGPPMKQTLQKFLKEVCPILLEEKIGFQYWVELTLSCPENEVVVEASAKAAKTASESCQKKWMVQTSSDVSAMSRMLRYHQPTWLNIRPLWSVGLPAELKPLLEAVAQWHKGQLDLLLNKSFNNHTEIDALLITLGSARCTLRQLRVCLGPSTEARQVLVSFVNRAKGDSAMPDLDIALLQPRQHQLDGLEGTRHWMFVLVQLDPSEGRLRCPLPRGTERPPELTINCSRLLPGEAVAKTAALIEDLAPKDGKFWVLGLHQWRGPDQDLEELMTQLKDCGVSTMDSHAGWRAAGTRTDGSCDSCRRRHQGAERCVRLRVPECDPRDAVGVTQVVTDDAMRQMASSLPHHPLPWLDVRMTGAPSPALEALMGAVAKWHHGNLDLNFNLSVPADEILALLYPAQCPLVDFRGCLTGSNKMAWRALVEGVQRAEKNGMKQVIAIRLQEPRQHELGKLEGTRHKLNIRVRAPTTQCERVRCPLPNSSSIEPSLIIEFQPAVESVKPGAAPSVVPGESPVDKVPGDKASGDEASGDEAPGNEAPGDEALIAPIAALIEDLAPKNMGTYYVILQHCPYTDHALDTLIKELSIVQTFDASTKSWTSVGTDSDGNCCLCRKACHTEKSRCVQLDLP